MKEFYLSIKKCKNKDNLLFINIIYSISFN
jgi:hypothetical protein